MADIQKISATQFIYRAAKPYRWHLLGLTACAFYAGADVSIGAYTLKLLLNNLQAAQAGGSLTFVFTAALFYVVMVAFMTLVWRLNDMLLLKFLPAFEATLIADLSHKITHQSHKFYQELFAGSITSKINDVADATPELFELIVSTVLWRISMIFIGIITLWLAMPTVALVTLVWAVLFLTSALLTAQHIHQLAEASSEARAQVSGAMADITSNIFAVRLFNAQSREAHGIKSSVALWKIAVQRRDWYLFTLFCVQGSLWVAREVISLWLIIHLFLHGKISIGDITMFFSLSILLISNTWSLTKDFSKMIKRIGKISQGLSTLLEPAEVVDAHGASQLFLTEGRIVFDDVQFRHTGSNVMLFDHLSLTIESGQKVGLVGSSGSGKTTFVNLLLRLYNLQAGSINIDNQDIVSVTQGSLREAIAFIPQDPSLFHRTLFENIQYGKADATTEEVIEAARRAHADEFIALLPEGYQTCVGDRALKLSGGQRQRIAIARAFLKHSRILIMDEATSALDSMTEKYIQESFHLLMRHATTIVVAHRLATLLSMDRILVFDKGRIVEDGTHEALIAQDGIYRKLWQAQSCGFLPDDTEEPIA